MDKDIAEVKSPAQPFLVVSVICLWLLVIAAIFMGYAMSAGQDILDSFHNAGYGLLFATLTLVSFLVLKRKFELLRYLFITALICSCLFNLYKTFLL